MGRDVGRSSETGPKALIEGNDELVNLLTRYRVGMWWKGGR